MSQHELAIRDGLLSAADLDPSPLFGPDHGALASFIGIVRNHHHGRGVTHIDYECHHALAHNVLNDLAQNLRNTHGDLVIRIIHATGRVVPGQAAVVIHITSAHRDAALSACREAIEALKVDLPVWKHEQYDDGSSAWLPGS